MGHHMPLNELRCQECGNAVEVLTHNGSRLALAPKGYDDQGWEGKCLYCGSDNMRKMVTPPLPMDLGDEAGVGKHYPRFDRGLQRLVKNKQHRKQLCKQMGVVPLDGDFDFEGQANKQFAEEDYWRGEYDQLTDEYENSPHFADYRRMRDKGALNDRVLMKQPWRKTQGLAAPKII